MKILDVNQVNTKPNYYHKFINWLFKRMYIRSFNKELKKSWILGSYYVECEKVTNLKKIGSSRTQKAAEAGERRAVVLIAEKYEFQSEVPILGIKKRFIIRNDSNKLGWRKGHGC